MVNILVLKLAFVILLMFILKSDALRQDGICSWTFYKNGSCFKSEFPCLDGTCIDRKSHCNGIYDCEDRSDESYCNNIFGCPYPALRKCVRSNKCIPVEWFCDGVEDCSEGVDEMCDESQFDEQDAKVRALHWLKTQRADKSGANVWGLLVDKFAVAFHLGGTGWLKENEATRREMAYELSIQLLSKLSKKNLEDIPSYELASFLNAYLVTCLNPRNFHGVNIVQELRDRVDRQNDTNPYVILSLCNAGDKIPESDKRKLLSVFKHKRKELWTDIRALAVMALACANKQSEDVDLQHLAQLFIKQYRNETAESVQTTALVMQALISVDAGSNPGGFNETEALEKVLAKQLDTGSFGNTVNTYYVLPMLNCQSLVDISSDHCESFNNNEVLTLADLTESNGSIIRISYSIVIGNNSDLERKFSLRVPANVSFYRAMQIAADLDNHKFEYTIQNGKPYVTSIFGKQDDPEKGKFWFLYVVEEEELVPIHKSPADIVPQDNDHFVLWYHGGIWTD